MFTDPAPSQPEKGGADAPPQPERADARWQQVNEFIDELTRDTTDEDPKAAMLRALAVYRSIVRHVKGGGTVKFVAADGGEKTLKVRIKNS